MTNVASRRGRRLYAWLGALIVAMTVVALTIGAFTLNIIEKRLVGTAGECLALAASDIANKLDLLMAERYGDILMMANSRTFQGGKPAEMTQYLEWMKTAYPVYEWLGVTDAAGRIVAATDPAAVGKDRSGREWFRTVREQGGVHIRDAQMSEDSGGIVAVAFTAPIIGQHGEFLGTVTSRVALPILEDVFVQTVTALQAQLGTTARVEYQFLRRTGVVIADSFLREEGTLNFKQMGVPSARLLDSAPTGYVEEEHLRRKVRVLTGYAQSKGVGEPKSLSWGVLVRVDRDDILAPINHVLLKVGGAGLIIFVPMLGILLWATRSLQAEYMIVQNLCAHAVRSENALRRRRHALEGLVDSACRLTAESDLQQLLRLVLETARSQTGAAYAALGVFDESGQRLAQFLTSGMDEATQKAIGSPPIGRGLLGHLTRTEGVLRIKDLTQHSASIGFPAHHPAMRSFLGVSIRAHNRLFGRLYLAEKQEPGNSSPEFTELDEQIVAALAAQAGAAIVNAQLLEQTREQATHDSLTGLWNHSAIIDLLSTEVARAEREAGAVGIVMADLDHFKMVNDTHGHGVGDLVLQEAARRMRGTVRAYDQVGRVGGEEFFMVLPGCDGVDAVNLAERLRACISDTPVATVNGPLSVTVSIGVTVWKPENKATPQLLMQAADKALYRAKHRGRNRVESIALPDAEPIDTDPD